MFSSSSEGRSCVCESFRNLGVNRLESDADSINTAQINLTTTTAHLYGYQVILGIGLGAYLQSGYAVIQAVLSPSDLAYAVSFMLSGKPNTLSEIPASFAYTINSPTYRSCSFTIDIRSRFHQHHPEQLARNPSKHSSSTTPGRNFGTQWEFLV